MKDKEQELLLRLQATFKIEAEERLQSLSGSLLELERTTAVEERLLVIERIYREAHSLKGAARAVNLSAVESLCQALESTLAWVKKQEISITDELLDLLHLAVTEISEVISSPENTQEVPGVIRRLLNLKPEHTREGQTESPEPEPQQSIQDPEVESAVIEPTPAAKTGSIRPKSRHNDDNRLKLETVRIPMAKLDGLLRQAEEMLPLKLSAAQRSEELQQLKESLDLWEREWGKISPRLRLLKQQGVEQGGGFAGAEIQDFLEWNYTFMKSFQREIQAQLLTARRAQSRLGGMVDNLLEDVKNAVMLPFSTILGSYPKLVRDLAKTQGKEVNLELKGSEVEVDKRILEELKDPLLHLVRNSIDHGIEEPLKREKINKPRRGTLTIAVNPVVGNKVELIIADDGSGIDIGRVKESIVKQGLISAQNAATLGEEDVLNFIFQSEVTTSKIITEISGRGLGLAIVREKVDRLNGSISVKTLANASTIFRILLPVTLATARGIIVKAGSQDFILPTNNVERVMRVQKTSISTVENKEVIRLEGRTISLVRLRDVLGINGNNDNEQCDYVQVAIVSFADKRLAFQVEEVGQEQEVLVRPLDKPLVRVRNISGATIMGSGRVILILNVADLMRTAANMTAPARVVPDVPPDELARKAILVAEDSITSRMLLKNILETAGYDVTTAVDGLDALTALKTEHFDLVVSDVEMPRLNGFELTARLRNDQKFAHLPVVLVTGLESREDKERGIDVGANAYIVKSSFDHGNLLSVISKLI